MSGQSFAINEDEGSANCGGWYLVNQLMMIVGLGEVKLSVTPSAADDDDEADDNDVDDDDDDDADVDEKCHCTDDADEKMSLC